jgi:hypothetical protein
MCIFKSFDHIGIVVRDLDKAISELSFFFAFECREQIEIKEAGIRIAFYPLGAGQMELLEWQKLIPLFSSPDPECSTLPFRWRISIRHCSN